MATTARNVGNIWMRRSDIIPIRRPRKRNRANAYAARAPKNTEKRAVAPEITSVFTYQLVYGTSSASCSVPSSPGCPLRIRRKLSSVTWSGISCALVSDGRGLNAAETTQMMGNSANRIAAMLTR